MHYRNTEPRKKKGRVRRNSWKLYFFLFFSFSFFFFEEAGAAEQVSWPQESTFSVVWFCCAVKDGTGRFERKRGDARFDTRQRWHRAA